MDIETLTLLLLGRLFKRITLLEEMFQELTPSQFESLKRYLEYRKSQEYNRLISEMSTNELYKALQLFVAYPRELKYGEAPKNYDN